MRHLGHIFTKEYVVLYHINCSLSILKLVLYVMQLRQAYK